VGAELLLTWTTFTSFAEDEKDTELLVKRAFVKAGLDVSIHFARDGVETLEYLRGEGKFKNRAEFPFPALLLLDFNMPRMNGLEVLKEIRGDGRLKKLVVVMLSSSVDEGQIAKAFDLGVNSYVEKPSDFSELVHAITSINQYWFGCNHFPHHENGIVRPNKRHRAALKLWRRADVCEF